MKVPISKQLTNSLLLPFIAITSAELYDTYSTGQKSFDQNIVFIILFGIPTLLFTWFLLDKKIEFKDAKKARKADRILRLPFSSFSTPVVLVISSFFLAGGLATMLDDKDTDGGFLMLMIGLSVILLVSIALEHPKIWFSDTLNLDDMLETIKNTPQENLSAYQDGIFSYSHDSFTIQLDKESKTILWKDISLIRAYKIDQYAVDCIVIEMQLVDSIITINDQTPGHMKFMDTASKKLINFKKDWFTVVAFPAFEKNLTTIYRRAKDEENTPIITAS